MTAIGSEWKWFNKEIQNSCKKWNCSPAVTALEICGAGMNILFYFWSFDGLPTCICAVTLRMLLLALEWQTALDWWVFATILLFVANFFLDMFKWKKNHTRTFTIMWANPHRSSISVCSGINKHANRFLGDMEDNVSPIH